MRKVIKHILSFVISIISFLLIIVLILPVLINLEPVSTFVEKELSDATGMEFRISGNMDLAVFPEQRISLEKITVNESDLSIAHIKRVVISVDLLSLLKGEKGIDQIELIEPSVYIERDKNGKLNIEKVLSKIAGRDESVSRCIRVGNITVADGSILYSDLQNGHDINLAGLNLSINDLDTGSAFPKHMSFTGNLGIKKLNTTFLAISDVSMRIDAEEGLFTASPIKLELLGGTGKGTATINVNGDYPMIAIRSNLSSLKLEKLFKTFNKENFLAGDFDVSIDINMQASGRETIKTIDGTFMFSGESIMVIGYDIDSLLSSYRKTPSIGLMDVAAFFLAGPFGVVINKGFELDNFYSTPTKQNGVIREFISSWEIKDGVASARDVAFATSTNRLALHGKLDFVNETYNDLVTSVVDTDGCSEFTQKISGPLNDPQFEEFVVKTVFGSTISLFKKIGKAVKGGKCNVFYAGAVQHPQSTSN